MHYTVASVQKANQAQAVWPAYLAACRKQVGVLRVCLDYQPFPRALTAQCFKKLLFFFLLMSMGLEGLLL